MSEHERLGVVCVLSSRGLLYCSRPRELIRRPVLVRCRGMSKTQDVFGRGGVEVGIIAMDLDSN